MSVFLPGWPSAAVSAALRVLSLQYTDENTEAAAGERPAGASDWTHERLRAAGVLALAEHLTPALQLRALLLGDFLQAPRVVQCAAAAMGMGIASVAVPSVSAAPCRWEVALADCEGASTTLRCPAYIATTFEIALVFENVDFEN